MVWVFFGFDFHCLAVGVGYRYGEAICHSYWREGDDEGGGSLGVELNAFCAAVQGYCGGCCISQFYGRGRGGGDGNIGGAAEGFVGIAFDADGGDSCRAGQLELQAAENVLELEVHIGGGVAYGRHREGAVAEAPFGIFLSGRELDSVEEIGCAVFGEFNCGGVRIEGYVVDLFDCAAGE